jgi:hypothetical protein
LIECIRKSDILCGLSVSVQAILIIVYTTNNLPGPVRAVSRIFPAACEPQQEMRDGENRERQVFSELLKHWFPICVYLIRKLLEAIEKLIEKTKTVLHTLRCGSVPAGIYTY